MHLPQPALAERVTCALDSHPRRPPSHDLSHEPRAWLLDRACSLLRSVSEGQAEVRAQAEVLRRVDLCPSVPRVETPAVACLANWALLRALRGDRPPFSRAAARWLDWTGRRESAELYALVRRQALVATRGGALADEVTQRAFWILYQGAPRWRGSRAYVYRVVLNVLRDQARVRGPRGVALEDGVEIERIPDSRAGAEERLLQAAHAHELREIIGRLSPRDAEILVRSVLEDRSDEEVFLASRGTDWAIPSCDQVRMVRRRALVRLKEELASPASPLRRS